MAVIRLSDEEVFSTDSGDYELLHNACIATKDVPGIVIEIGTRRGGSAKIMMDAFASVNSTDRLFICVDPYGNIETQLTNLNVNRYYKNLATTEGDPNSKSLSTGVRLDYTNEMRNRVVPSLYYYAFQKGFNFTFFFLEDTEFFERYGDGIPAYNGVKTLENTYAMVFLDGPHTNTATMEETKFFHQRSVVGTVIVYDDLWQYEHDEEIESWLFDNGYELLEKTELKASYRRIK